MDEDRDENPDEESNARVVSSTLGRTTTSGTTDSQPKTTSGTVADRVMKMDTISQLHQFEEPSPESMPPPPPPVLVSEVMGCGIPALAKQINEHRKDPVRKKQKLHFR